MQVTDFKPALCAACFQAKPEATFVDFHADYDGPTFRDDSGQLQSIEDLKLCEDCVREGATALALHIDPQREVELERDAAQAQADGWREYALNLEETYGRRPEPIKRPPGRPPRSVSRPVAA